MFLDLSSILAGQIDTEITSKYIFREYIDIFDFDKYIDLFKKR